MIKRPLASVIKVAAATVVILAVAAAPAGARGGPGPSGGGGSGGGPGPSSGGGGGGGGGGRPCGPTNFASGNGSLGTAWTLDSKYDDDAGLQVGEEFEVNDFNTADVWTITFIYNGTTFATGQVAATSTGVRDVERASYTGGTSLMTISAVNNNNGETVNGSVQDPVIPTACGQR